MKVYFIGIGGIGMSGMAHLLRQDGHEVLGSDVSASAITQLLAGDDITVFADQTGQHITTDLDLVIYSAAIPDDNAELLKARSLNIPTHKYSELLGELCHQRTSIAVCGTHGKTTVTGMLYSIFLAAQKSPSCLVGSLMKDFGGRNSIGGDDDTFILEACEYKGNFKNLRPNYVLSTNVDFDHCDYFQTEDHYFRTFKSFFSEVPPDGFIVMRVEDSVKVGADYFRCKVFFYDKYVDVLRSCDDLKMQVFGEHNYWNAACAYAFAHEYGIAHADIIKGLNSFSGTWRRMEYRGRLSGARVYDDYAHHPTEVRATLAALREKYADNKIRVVFQPHQFSRTKFFLNEFARSFDDADEVIVPNIYRVRDSDTSAQSVTVDDLVHKLSAYKSDSVRNGEGLKNTSDYIQHSAKDGEIIVLMGAGDVTNVQNNWTLET